MNTCMCDGSDLSAGTASKEPRKLMQLRSSVSGWAYRRLRQGFDIGKSWARERRTTRILSRLPDSVLADIGFRRVDICGQPLRHRSAEARCGGDFPVLALVPMEINPTFIERMDTWQRTLEGRRLHKVA